MEVHQWAQHDAGPRHSFGKKLRASVAAQSLGTSWPQDSGESPSTLGCLLPVHPSVPHHKWCKKTCLTQLLRGPCTALLAPQGTNTQASNVLPSFLSSAALAYSTHCWGLKTCTHTGPAGLCLNLMKGGNDPGYNQNGEKPTVCRTEEQWTGMGG